jgi:hypothetical protein
VLDCTVTVEEQPSVRKGVVGDIDDPHYLNAHRAHLRNIKSKASARDAALHLN